MTGCVYVLTSPSGKFYVGMTQRDEVWRFYAHKNLKTARPLSHAVQKYGWENFKREIVFRSSDKNELVAKEIELIAAYNCMVPHGYNCTAGGEGITRMKRPPHVVEALRKANTGKKASDKTRAKLRAAHIKTGPRNSFTGRKHTPESLAKMSAAKLGQGHTDETRAKMSRSRMGRSVSDETRAKLKRAASSQSAEVKQRIADGMRRVWAERKANA